MKAVETDRSHGNDRFASGLSWAAVIWCVAVIALGIFLPVYSVSSGTVGPDGSFTSVETSETLVEANGNSVLILLAVPALVALVATLALRAKRRTGFVHGITIARVATVVLLFGALLGGFTIGIYFLPAVVMLILAALMS